jgi:hypothetical protein
MAESRLRDRPPEFWAAVAEDYRADKLTVREILSKHDLTVGEFGHARIKLGWRRRQISQLNRKHIIIRLFHLLDAQVRAMENDMDKPTSEQAMALSRLVTALDKLIELKDADAKQRPAPRRASKTMIELRAKIADRIAHLNQA